VPIVPTHTIPPQSEPCSASPYSRRAFLTRSLSGGVLLGSAALLARCSQRRVPLLITDQLALNNREFGTLKAFAGAVLPPPETSAPVIATSLRVDLEVSRWRAKNQKQVKQLLSLIEDGTRYFLFSWRAFSDLSLAERRSYLRGWESSRFDFRREAYQALRMLVFFFYYSQDATWRSIGYNGPWLKSTPVGLQAAPAAGPESAPGTTPKP